MKPVYQTVPTLVSMENVFLLTFVLVTLATTVEPMVHAYLDVKTNAPTVTALHLENVSAT